MAKAQWCSVSKSSGTGSVQGIKVSGTEYSGRVERLTELTAKTTDDNSPEQSVKIPVHQVALEQISIQFDVQSITALQTDIPFSGVSNSPQLTFTFQNATSIKNFKVVVEGKTSSYDMPETNTIIIDGDPGASAKYSFSGVLVCPTNQTHSDVKVTMNVIGSTSSITQTIKCTHKVGSFTYIITSPAEHEFPALGGSYKVTAAYDTYIDGTKVITGTELTDFTLTSSSSYFSILNDTIIAVQNTSAAAREATITISKTGYTSAEFIVSQVAGIKVFEDIVISQFEYANSIPAAGGSVMPTVAYSQKWTWNGVEGSGGTITSGAKLSYAFKSTSNHFQINSATGKVSAPNNTQPSIQTSNAIKLTVVLNGKTATKETTAQQIAGTRVYETPIVTKYSYDKTASAAGEKLVPTVAYSQKWTWNGVEGSGGTITSGGTIKYYDYSMALSPGATLDNATGNITWASRSTTIGVARNAVGASQITVTLNGKTSLAYKNTKCEQEANKVESAVKSANLSFSYPNASAAGGTVNPSTASTFNVVLTFTSGDTATTKDNTYSGLTLTPTKTFAMTAGNGFTLASATTGALTVASRGTTIGNVRTSNTVTYTYKIAIAYSSKFASLGTIETVTSSVGGTCTQNANLITKAVSTSTMSYGTVAAAKGGTLTPTLNGSCVLTFSSGLTVNITTASEAPKGTTITSSAVYSFPSAVSWADINANTGVITVDSRGTTVGSERSAEAQRTLTWTIKHDSTYGGSTIVSTGSAYKTTFKQAANAVTYAAPTVTASYPQIIAKGGTSTPTVSYSQVATYTSEATTTISSGATLTWAVGTAKTGWSLSTSNGVVTAPNNTSTSVVTATNFVSLTVALNGKSATKQLSPAQSAGAKVYADWTFTITPSKTSLSKDGDTATITISRPSRTYTWNDVGNTLTENASSGTITLKSSQSAFTLNSTSITVGSATSYTATLTAAENKTASSRSGTVTATYSGISKTTASITQAAATIEYRIVAKASATTLPANGATGATITATYDTYINGNLSTSGTALTSFTVASSNTAFTVSGTTVTVSNNTTTSQRTSTITVSKPGYTSDTLTLTQTAGAKVYAKPVISTYTYSETAPASGKALSPTVTYSQTWTWNGVSGSGGTLSSGGTITYAASSSVADATLTASTGILTWASRGTTIGALRSCASALTATVSMNGQVSAAKACTKCEQSANLVTAILAKSDISYATTATAAGGTLTCTRAGSWDLTYTSGSKQNVSSLTDTSNYTVEITQTWSFPSTVSWATINSANGTITVQSRGTTEGAARSAKAQRLMSATLTHIASLGSSIVKSTGDPYQATFNQALNKIVSVAITGKASAGTVTTIPAGGGTVTWTDTVTYSSGSTATSGYTASFSSSGTGATTTTAGVTTWATRGTTAGAARSATVTCSVTSSYTTTAVKTTATTTQVANAITTYGTPTLSSFTVADIPARGGSISSGTLGTWSQTTTYTSGATATITPTGTPTYSTAVSAPSLGTTVKSRTSVGTLTVSLTANGKTGSKSATVYQAANSVTSYSDIQPLKFLYPDVAASGGSSTPSVTYEQTATYTSGSKSTITSGASITYARATRVNTDTTGDDPEFFRRISVYKYPKSGSSYLSHTRVSSGYPTGLPNNSGYAIKIANTGTTSPGCGGFSFSYAGEEGETYICTFTAWVPTGRNIVWATNSIGTGGTQAWLTPHAGLGKWATYSFQVKFGTKPSSSFYFYLNGAYGTSSSPVVWWLASAHLYKVSNVSASSPTFSTTTGAFTLASRGTTKAATEVNANSVAKATITLNGKTTTIVSGPTQLENAITKTDYEYGTWSVTCTANRYTTSASPCPAEGGTATLSGTAKRSKTPVYTWSSGSTSKGSATTESTTVTSFGIQTTVAGASLSGSTLTWASRGTTAGAARSVQVYGQAYSVKSSLITIYQELNEIESYKYGTWTISLSANAYTSSSSPCPAGGGSSTITATCSRTKTPVYTSGSSGTATSESATPSVSATGTGFSYASGKVTIASRGTTVGEQRTGTVTATYSGATTKTLTLYQQANAKSYGTITIGSFSYPSVAAAGPVTSTPTLSSITQATSYTSGSTSSETLSSYTKSFAIGTAVTGSSVASSTGVVTWTNNATTSSRSVTVTVTITANSKSATKNATCSQSAGAKVYATPTISAYSYATFAAAGATKTPTVTYSQTWTWNGVSGSGGTITSGATLKFAYSPAVSGATLGSTTTGSVTWASRGTTTGEARSCHSSLTVTVTLNSKSATKTCTACTQEANEVESYNYGSYTADLSLNSSSALSAGAETRTVTYGKIRRSKTPVYTSGAAGTATTEYWSGTAYCTISVNTGASYCSLSSNSYTNSSTADTATLTKTTYGTTAISAQTYTISVRQSSTTGTVIKSITVTSTANTKSTGTPTITFTMSATKISYDGGTSTVTDRTVTIPYTWTSGSKGNDTTTADVKLQAAVTGFSFTYPTLTVAKNTGAARSCVMQATYSGATTKTITITQEEALGIGSMVVGSTFQVF